MAERLPLSSLLSHALVAYTIEFDNAFEERAPHSATVKKGAGIHGGHPWLVSQTMWTNLLRHVGGAGTPVCDLQALAYLSDPQIKSQLHHLEWWAYITFAPDPSGTRAKPRYRDLLVHLTPGAKRACEVWRPLNAEIDGRWRKRFGKATIDRLVTALRTIVSGVGAHLPDYLPVVQYGAGMRALLVFPDEPPERTPVDRLDISALISRALLAFALDVERTSDVSITIAADVLRVIDVDGTSLKELPMRAGVAKEGMTAAVNLLKKVGFISVVSDKAKTVQLTAKGKHARDESNRLVAAAENEWFKTFGKATVSDLRDALEALGEGGELAAGLETPTGGWRSMKPYAAQTEAFLRDPRATLPHHPMVLHRGGYPDGS